jgi:hypothetical protein
MVNRVKNWHAAISVSGTGRDELLLNFDDDEVVSTAVVGIEH